MTPLAAWLEEVEARASKATPVANLCRYPHGGGRMTGDHLEPGDHRELIADFYTEGDREFYFSAKEDVPALVALLRLAVSVVDAGRDVRDSTKGAHGLVKAADPRTVVALACALADFDAAVATRSQPAEEGDRGTT